MSIFKRIKKLAVNIFKTCINFVFKKRYSDTDCSVWMCSCCKRIIYIEPPILCSICNRGLMTKLYLK